MKQIRNAVLILGFAASAVLAQTKASTSVVDTSTMHHKVMCGYQGWFRCPEDGTNEGWRHWGRRGVIAPGNLAFEMWPDMSEYGKAEKNAAPGFTHPDGTPAYLFSAADPKTVDLHFAWMRDYGIDGVFFQRFLADLRHPSVDRVLDNVRQSARRTGRAWALCYDLSGANPDKLFDTLVNDWKRLVDERRITADDRYLRHNGKPVLFVWGFYDDRFSPELANRVIDFFKNDPKYGVTLIGGCQWYWRRTANPEWAKVFRRFDIISPWNTGHYMRSEGRKYAATAYWKDDLEEARKAGMKYLPVIYPGFGWTNLQGPDKANDLPRLGGEFFWRQFTAAAELGMDMAYVAMFDEVNEGTAIFKVTNTPPRESRFATYEGLPPDWYLRLTAEGTRLIRGERKPSAAVPIRP